MCFIIFLYFIRVVELLREVFIILMFMYNLIYLYCFKNIISIMVNFISKDNLEMLKFYFFSIIVNVGRDYRYIEIKNG